VFGECKRVRKSLKTKEFIPSCPWANRLFTFWGPGPPPLFFVSVASKGLTVSLSPLFATHTRVPGSVASKELALHQNCAERRRRGSTVGGFGRAAWPIETPLEARGKLGKREGMVGRAPRNRAELRKPLYHIGTVCQALVVSGLDRGG